MSTDDDAITRFVTLTQCSVDQARFFIEATNGNFDRAVTMFYEQATVSPRAVLPRIDLSRTAIPPRPSRAPLPVPAAPRPFSNVFGVVLMAPLAILRGSFKLLFSTIGVAYNVVSFVGHRFLPRFILDKLQGVVNALNQSNQEMDAQVAAEIFTRNFEERYGERRPRFVECGWQEAAARAHQQLKFLFVYLHSPNHQDADTFCSHTLCSSDCLDFINRSFVAWGGDVRFADAFRLSSSLRVSRYPYVALLAFSASNIRLVMACEGACGADQLTELLHRAHNQYNNLMAGERAAQQEREWTRRLREEQDVEYQRSLEADRQRERAREEARKKAEAEARAAAQVAAKIKSEQEAAARRRAERQAAIEQRREAKRSSLLPEPPAGSGGGVASVRVRLPDGLSFQRRFDAELPLQRVYDFVDSLDEMKHWKYSLVNTFPRMVYGSDYLSKTLAELGLAPSAALLVQPDSDEE